MHLSREDLKWFAIEREVTIFHCESMRLWSLRESVDTKKKTDQR